MNWQQWLQNCAEEFGMQLAIISRIDEVYRVEHAYSELGLVAPGDEFDRNATYCAEVLRRGESLSFSHVGAMADMCLHPCYKAMHVESYIGVPLIKDGAVIGTLNFSSLDPQENEFPPAVMQRAQEMAEYYLSHHD